MEDMEKKNLAIRIENGNLVIPLATVIAAGAKFDVDMNPTKIGVMTLRALITPERFASVIVRDMTAGIAEAPRIAKSLKIHSDWDDDEAQR